MFKNLTALLLLAQATTKVTLDKVPIDGDWAKDEGLKAVKCMDGSVPHFYFKAASSQDPNQRRKWLIYREPGPVCHDQESCD